MLHRSIRTGRITRPFFRGSSRASLCNGTVPCASSSAPRRWKSRFAFPEGMKAYEDDWVDEPEYPKIDPEIHDWKPRRRERLQQVFDWYETIKAAPNPECKIFEYNRPHRFGYVNFRITENAFDYDSEIAYKYITRTHVVSRDGLPSQYSSPDLIEKVQHFKEKLKGPLADALAFELNHIRSFEHEFNANPQSIDSMKSQRIVPQINRVILSILGEEIDYLKDCHVDVKPKVEAFWRVGGMQPAIMTRKLREKNMNCSSEMWRAKYVKPEDPKEEHMHYIGDSLLQVRCKHPPENLVDSSDSLCQRSIEEFPDRFPHFLQAYGFRRPNPAPQHRFCSIIPGHWSGDDNRCNLVAFHGRHHLLFRDRIGNEHWTTEDETESALFSQAMLVSFGRLLAQAMYHGFDQFNDLDYPFSTQTILTNGLEWSFFAYQLNTMKLDKLSLAKNQKQNLLWGTKSESIFSKEKEGELNDSVLENILKFYLNEPKPIAVENPTPYLNPTRRIQDDWGDQDKERHMLYYAFHSMVVQRPYITDYLIDLRPPEIYEWEKIYKIYYQARPLDARKRFFEFPKGFPGSRPENEPYELRDPLYQSKGVRWNFALTEKKREKERLEAEKKAEAERLGVVHRKRKNKDKKDK